MMEKMLLVFVVSTTFTVNFILALEADTVQLITDPEGPYIRSVVGEPFHIACRGIGDEETKFSFMKWQNPAGSVLTKDVMKNGNKLFLSISNPSSADSGTYNCSAVYNNERNLQYEIHLEFYNLKPEFSSSFHNLTIRENAPTEIYCSARGQSPIIYSWYNQEGVRIPENEHGSIFVLNLGNQSTLKIQRTEIEHEGMYKCIAENSFGTTSSVYALFVLGNADDGHPSFVLPFETAKAAEGSRLILRCQALGAKPMTYTWYNQDEDRITENTSMSIFVSNIEDYSLLNFEELHIEDEGLYTCSASNSYGLQSKIYLLRVSNGSDTNATSQFRNAKVVNVSANSVQFHIATSGSVEYIEAKYTEKRNNRSISKVFKPVAENVYKIDNLVPSGLYNFQFRTIPPEGNDWSKVYPVTMLPDIPEIIFKWIDLNGVTISWFRSIDDIWRGTIDSHEIKYSRASMQTGGNTWKPPDCEVTVQVPSCMGRQQHTISGLTPMMYYQIEVRAHTAAGYGEANRQKVYVAQ